MEKYEKNTDIFQEFLKDAAKYYMGPQCTNFLNLKNIQFKILK